MAKHNARGRAALDPDAVLAGKERPSAPELLDLIHRENPTGRALGAREEEARYARKARLQSLLVRRFAEELSVVPDGEGTVSLRHRGQGRDGCHAVIDALDEDARAWVRRELDLSAGGEEAPEVTARAPAARPGRAEARDAETPGEMIAGAAEAVEAYDYELGRALLERALAADGGSVEAARPLLSLLVETLGDDAAALGAEGALSPAALADPAVRGLLAVAAARAGEEDRAAALCRGAREDQAAQAFAALGAGALSRGDDARAGACLDRARRLDPACPALATIEAELARARDAARGPAEAEIAALLSAGQDAEATRAAEAVLSRWPESEAARRALRALEERRRRATAEKLVAEAEAALRAGEASAAAQLFRAAAAAAVSGREALERRAAELEAAERARRDAEQAERAARALEGGDLRGGLLAYLDLGEAAQALVRARGRRRELGALDQTVGGRGARVEAAMALGRAADEAERDPAGARALLVAHEEVLERVPEARRLRRAVERRLAALQAEEARAKVIAARADLARGAAAEARARLTAATLRDLPEAERGDAEALRDEAERRALRHRRAAEMAELRGAGRLFEARALAEQLALEDERGAIQAEIQRAFRVEVDDEPQPAAELGRLRRSADRDVVARWLTADGRRAVFARARERWVIVRVLHLETGAVHPTVLLRTPEPLGDVQVTVSDEALWVVGERGALLQLSLDGWNVRDFRPGSDVAAPSEVVESADLAFTEEGAAPRYFWVGIRKPEVLEPKGLRVIDLAQRRVVRELRDAWRAETIHGLPLVAVHPADAESVALYQPRGAPARPARLPTDAAVQGLAADPEGRGLLVAMGPDSTQPEAHDFTVAHPLRVGLVSPEGVIGPLLLLGDTNAELVSCLAATRGSNLVFVTAHDDPAPRLFALDASGAELRLLWTAPASEETILAQDAGSRRVVALAVHDVGVDITPLGREPAALPERPAQLRVPLPDAWDIHGCGRRDDVYEEARSLRELPPAEAVAQALELERGCAQGETGISPERLVAVCARLELVGNHLATTTAKEMAARLFERYPQIPAARLLRANHLALQERWVEAREALVGLEMEGLPDSEAQHVHHLRALGALNEQRFEQVAAELEQGLRFQGDCKLTFLAELVGVRSEEPGDAAPLRRLVEAIRAADDCFARRDDAGALAALDQPVVWAAKEVQSLARLADAHLRAKPATGRARLRCLEALGALLDVLDAKNAAMRREAMLVGAWPEAQIHEVAERARAFLDAP